MKKLATLLLTSALVGGLTLTSFATTASAAGAYGGNNRGNFAPQQMQQSNGQNMRAPGMGANNGTRGPGMRGGIAQGGLVHFMCTDNGAPRVEIALNNMSDRLTLDDNQTALFDSFQTAALTAQTAFADACTAPAATAGTSFDPVELLEMRVTNQTANIAAIEAVLPSLEAFYNSLTDEQKADLLPQRGTMRVGQGQFTRGQGPSGQFGPGAMNWDNDNFARGQGNPRGQGYGPRNNS